MTLRAVDPHIKTAYAQLWSFAIERQQSTMKRFPELGRIFMPKDEVPSLGQVIRQTDLGEVLKAVATQGADVFYQGWVGQAIAAVLTNLSLNWCAWRTIYTSGRAKLIETRMLRRRESHSFESDQPLDRSSILFYPRTIQVFPWKYSAARLRRH